MTREETPVTRSCVHCEELRREEKEALAASDPSRATDCRVLRNRHPNHDDPPTATAGEPHVAAHAAPRRA